MKNEVFSQPDRIGLDEGTDLILLIVAIQDRFVFTAEGSSGANCLFFVHEIPAFAPDVYYAAFPSMGLILLNSCSF